ncbi:hypothetical protein BN1723_019979, partial [Verticillium longisporum]
GYLPRHRPEGARRRSRPLRHPRVDASRLQRQRGRDGARQGPAQGFHPPVPRRHHRHCRGHWPPAHHHRPPRQPRRD